MNKLMTLILLAMPCISFSADQSPYAGEQYRTIKSLSEPEIESLRRGDGMGFAKLAELNHYPGPKHVLEVADALGLTPLQLTQTQILYEEMRHDAVELGNKLVAAEIQLDSQFADTSVTPRKLKASLRKIASFRARLRYVHLEAHLRQKQILSPQQIQLYDSVRGYHDPGHDPVHNHRHEHGAHIGSRN